MYWNSSVMQFLIVSIVYCIPESEVHKNSSLLVTSGLKSIKMFVTGPEPVYSVKDPKFTDIPRHPWVHSRHQTVDLKFFLYRYSGSFATFQWIYLSINLHWSFHLLARSFADHQHYNRQVSVQGWISRFGSYHGQKETVWVNAMEPSMQLLGCKRIRTTSYHPIANGLVKRFHCQLKSKTKVTQPSGSQYFLWFYWAFALHSKLIICCTTAELVYGTILRLPGEVFNTCAHITTTDPSSQATPPRQPLCKNTAVSSALSNAFMIHHDVVKKPLQQWTISGGKRISQWRSNVFIDHLKPAFLELPSLKQPDVSITPVSSQSTTTVSNHDKAIIHSVHHACMLAETSFLNQFSGGGVL